MSIVEGWTAFGRLTVQCLINSAPKFGIAVGQRCNLHWDVQRRQRRKALRVLRQNYSHLHTYLGISYQLLGRVSPIL